MKVWRSRCSICCLHGYATVRYCTRRRHGKQAVATRTNPWSQ